MVAGANSSTPLTTTLLQRPRPFEPKDILSSMGNSKLDINGSPKGGKNYVEDIFADLLFQIALNKTICEIFF